MKHNYRHQARESLKRANAELASGDDERIEDAALKLRKSIEAITYDRAQAYADELPPSEYDVWVPKKLMAVLLEIEPHADKNSTLSFAEESSPGIVSGEMVTLGSETVFGMAEIKANYDALGSYLHIPTPRQIAKQPILDYVAARKRCEDVADFLAKVLASGVHNVTIGSFAKMNCKECDAVIRKRVPHSTGKTVAECFNCKASYTLTCIENGNVEWESEGRECTCGHEGCGHKVFINRREIEPGIGWNCPACKKENRLGIGVVPILKKTG